MPYKFPVYRNEQAPTVQEDCRGFRMAISQKMRKFVGSPRACYVDGMWNQEDADKWLTIIQVPVEKEIMRE